MGAIQDLVPEGSLRQLRLVNQDHADFTSGAAGSPVRLSGRLQLRRRRKLVELEAELLTEEIVGTYNLGLGHVQTERRGVEVRD